MWYSEIILYILHYIIYILYTIDYTLYINDTLCSIKGIMALNAQGMAARGSYCGNSGQWTVLGIHLMDLFTGELTQEHCTLLFFFFFSFPAPLAGTSRKHEVM